jgi:hypothetical protein
MSSQLNFRGNIIKIVLFVKDVRSASAGLNGADPREAS